ncbi:hypothetical protein [Roseateles toxinivorans]|uniref:Uncharacterized protein n=1 Tax=Roseateles toxinivorans TaxID=270368 RepID=A0A4R6QT52_9BURK|nr:hypothetical protein [Roseateles toxinivorans]TDP74531.1 hypothetical protein DES47_101592 [Roseateles toxinivorans]
MMYCECIYEGGARCGVELAQETKSDQRELWFAAILAIALALSAAQAFGA